MAKINIQPLSIEGLKNYAKNSPSKFKDKFGDLDLDNIPKEYMKVLPSGEEYFDSIQYRADVLSKKAKTPVMKDLPKDFKLDLKPSQPAEAPDLSPSHIGDEQTDTVSKPQE